MATFMPVASNLRFHAASGRVMFKVVCKPPASFLRLITRNIEQKSTCNVRVRFAPSPTGYLHLGGLRTALYNFLFARSQKGKFILRIEDTDQNRAVPGAVTKLKEALLWAGIKPDEGPGIGGNHGPYVQSERLEIYHKKIKTLLDNNWAYPCFCTARRLDLMRKEATRKGEPSKYDNRCRSLTPEQVSQKVSEGQPYVVRLKLEPTSDPWDDMVKGETTHDIFHIEGDPILLKSDGYPTYHFANVVDDHLMGVTHVLRGSEWLSSTPKHILLYKAFGWKHPEFGHLPLIVNPDGSKLSKRQGDLHIEQFQETGYFAQALLNYITTVGGGFHKETLGLTLEEMCESFDLKTVRKNSGRLNPVFLMEANRHLLREKVNSKDPQELADLTQQVKEMVLERFGDRLQESPLKEQILSAENILNIIRWSIVEDRATVLKDYVKADLEFFWVTPSQSQLSELFSMEKDPKSLLSDALEWISRLTDFSVGELSNSLKEFKEKEGTSKKFFPFMRMALSGLKQGAPLAEMMSVLGKENVIMRLESALENVHQLEGLQ